MMLPITMFPHILAGLNSASVVILITGFFFIRSGDKQKHKAMMISALCVAVVFLALYAYYHANAGLAKFGGEGMIRPFYFSILIAHVVGAIILTPFVPFLVLRAAKGRFDAHKRLAHLILPLWLYVSFSGIVIYVMAIHIYPFGG